MSVNQYFRAGTGTVLYTEDGKIACFCRTDNQTVWQLQQGGMDAGESISQTLWRELVEETGLQESDIAEVTSFPEWLYYTYSPNLSESIKDKNCLGQIHQWFYLKLTPGTVIDLSKASDQEFSAVRFVTFDELLAETDNLKHAVYTKLATYFKEEVLKN